MTEGHTPEEVDISHTMLVQNQKFQVVTALNAAGDGRLMVAVTLSGPQATGGSDVYINSILLSPEDLMPMIDQLAQVHAYIQTKNLEAE
jgi:hypothetical protein